MALRNAGKGKNIQTISSIVGDQEKIEEFVETTRIGKDKIAKKYLICITHLKGSHMNYSLFFIHQAKDNLKLKQRFALIDLKLVDFLADSDSSWDFQLSFSNGSSFHFVTDSWNKKKTFLLNLFKLCSHILPKEALPVFKNVNTHMLEEKVHLSDTLKDMQFSGISNPAENIEHEYKLKYLTKEEEVDLESVCMNCLWEVESAEEFIAKRTMELSGLDKANIHSIIDVEEEVSKLFNTMDGALKKLDLLEQSLSYYSETLARQESMIIDISYASSKQSLKTENNLKLLEETKALLDLLTMPCNLDDLDTLNDYNLETFSSTVNIVQQKMDILATHELNEMTCVQETMIGCQNFLKSVPELLHNELREKFLKDWQGKHRARHINVARFASLISWCKEFNPNMYNAIFQSYIESIRKCYDKEITNFFKDKVVTIQKRSNHDKGFSFAGRSKAISVVDLAASQRNIRSSVTNLRERGSRGSIDSINTKGSGESLAHCQHQSDNISKFDTLFCRVLDFISPLVVDEECHLHDVFDIPYLDDIPGDASDEEVRSLKEKNESTNNLLIKLLGAKLDQELKNLIEVSYKVDNYYSLYMFLRLVKPSHKHDGSTFLKRFYYSCLVLVKRQFDQFIKHQVSQITENTKVNSSKRVGILHCVHKYDSFLNDTEKLLDKQDRRTEIEKGYMSLLEAIFQAIDRVSKEQHKVPSEVVMLENYHHITQLLKTVNLGCLREHKDTAEKVYRTNLSDYVNVKLGNPIDKISTFFSGVKVSLSSAVREEEIGFQINFSRSVLKAILKQYSLKEVRKSIEHTLNQIEKHLCPEEGLYELVSRTYCNGLLDQLAEYQDLLRRCYPDSGLSFEFREDEIRRVVENRLQQQGKGKE